MVNGSRLYRALESVSIASLHQLRLALLPFTYARSESINADSLKLQLLTALKEWWQQQTVYPRQLPVNCETHCVSGN